MAKEVKEWILCAAIWFDDGKKYHFQPKNVDTGVVFCGLRHACIFQQVGGTVGERQKLGIHQKEQGFLTNLNRFVDRKEGWKIAMEADQIPEHTTEYYLYRATLYSEDLY